MLHMELLGKQILKNMLCITDKRDSGTYILANFSRIHINMNQYLILCNQIRLTDRTVCHAGAYHDNQVCLIHCTVGTRFPVISDHSVIKRMFCRHHTNSHHCGNNRNVMLHGKFL